MSRGFYLEKNTIFVQKNNNFQVFLPFLPEALSKKYQQFQASNLGKIYHAIPWDKLTKTLDIKNKRKSPQTIFSPQGKLALMFLKAYSQTSDKKLIEQMNGNIHYQFFCGICLHPGQQLTNYKIVSQI